MQISMTKKIVGTALFAALSFVVSFLEFPIFPAAPFLKLDFSCVFSLLSGFIYGPVYGIVTVFVKELLRFIIGSGTGGVGEIANFLITSSFIILPTLVYKFRKGLKTVILTLFLAAVIQVIVSLIVNRYINFPLYMNDSAKVMFEKLWNFIALFNLIKAAAVSIVTILLYKRTSALIKRI